MFPKPNKLLVTGSQQQGYVRVSPGKLEQLGLFQDDFVYISGKFHRKTYALITIDVYLDPTVVAIPYSIYDNILVRDGDVVTLKPADEMAQIYSIKMLPFKEDLYMYGIEDAESTFETHIKPFLEGRMIAVNTNDVIEIERSGRRIGFLVALAKPFFGFISSGTQIFLQGDLPTREQLNKSRDLVGFADIGGIDKQLVQIRETIELPLKYPYIFEMLGIKPPKGVLLHGPPGCGKTTIGRAIANEVGAFFLLLNGPEIMSAMAGESEKNLRYAFEKAEEEALKTGCAIIFIDEIDVIGGTREDARGEVEKRVVSQLLTLLDGVKPRSNVLIIAATNRPNALDPSLRRFGRFDREICLGVPDTAGRLKILQLKTRRMQLAGDVDLEYLADNTQGFVGADLAQLCTEAALHAIREHTAGMDYDEQFDGAFKVEMPHFKAALTGITPSTLRDTVIEMPKTTWDDIGGLENVKRDLKYLIYYPIQYTECYERFGVEASHGAMFFGPPGNGKTLLAKAIANECQSNFISVKGPELLSMWMGESERAVRQIFDKARQAQPCVLFLDELDSIARHRGTGVGGGGEAADRMLNYLLTEIDGVGSKKQVFVIGATNRPDTIDPALIRGGRLDQMIYIDMPDYDARISILKAYLRKATVAYDVDLTRIAAATDGYSGADLAEICYKTVQIAVTSSVQRYETQKNELSVRQQAGEDVAEALRLLEYELKSGVLRREHFESAVRSSRKSVKDSDLKRYDAFKREFCDSQQGGNGGGSYAANFSFDYVGSLLRCGGYYKEDFF